MREYLNDTFSDKWTSRRLVTSPAPIELPARSPDLTTCDQSLWRCIKGVVSKKRCQSNNYLKAAVPAAFGILTPAMLRKMSHRAWPRITLVNKKILARM